MMTRDELETLLKIHGESLNSPTERIHEILSTAGYPPADITLLLTYKLNHPDGVPKRVSGLHKVFRTDQSLAPDEINALLGVEVTVDIIHSHAKPQSKNYFQTAMIVFFTVLLAAFGLVFAMYFGQVGIFHEAAVFGSMRQ